MRIIILSGLAQTPADWDKVTACLPQHQCTPWQLYENSRLPADFDQAVEQHSRALAAADEDFVLAGLSLGAITALAAVLRQRPPRLKGLSLAGGHYKLKGNPFYWVQRLFFRLAPAAFLAKWGWEKSNLLPFFRSLHRIDFSDRLPTLDMPVQLIAGDRDFSNGAAAKQMAALLPDAELHIIGGAGHMLSEDCPERLAALLGRFADKAARR